ncbi:MAG: molybdenum cofactor guanylyltransferase [Melioribacteraceae bacterium]|nr:molybdenum cofactor guanylyltransferase [Melioribacteraceae bacterium]
MYKNITGIILAGGKSTRMGENKALLKVNDDRIVDLVVNLMRSVFDHNIIITNTPEDFEHLNIPLYKDIYEYQGPLAGIHSGLKHSATEQNFVMSVDMPLMTSEIIRYIVDYPTDKPVTVCRADGFIQQLAGRYSSEISGKAEELLRQNTELNNSNTRLKNKCAVLRLLDETGVEIIDAHNLGFYAEGSFYNMNRPEDYEFILSKLGSA